MDKISEPDTFLSFSFGYKNEQYQFYPEVFKEHFFKNEKNGNEKAMKL
jgi:hypothetical protein